MDRRLDLKIAKIAQSQHWVFTRAQAVESGASAGQIRTRLRTGRWVRLHSGIYTLPGASTETRTLLQAATLAIPDSIASHESAAELHEFSHVPRGRVCVTAPPGANHRLPLGTVHEYKGILDADHTLVDGIPTTTQPLTVFHLAAVLGPKTVEHVLDDRLNARAVDLDDMFALSDFWARKGFPGSRLMRGLLARRGPGYTAPESRLEAEFLMLIHRFGLPEPVSQIATPWNPAEGRIDFAYPPQRLLIELDGRRWHGRDADFETDRRRDRAAQKAGWIVLRYTWHEITRMPEHVAAELRSFLETKRSA